MGLPWIIAFLVIIAESIGSLSLIAGFLTRFTAGSFILIMLGAIVTVHWPQGFFMYWFGRQQGEGFEYHLLVIGMSAALLIAGGGKWALDGFIARWLEHRTDRVPARWMPCGVTEAGPKSGPVMQRGGGPSKIQRTGSPAGSATSISRRRRG